MRWAKRTNFRRTPDATTPAYVPARTSVSSGDRDTAVWGCSGRRVMYWAQREDPPLPFSSSRRRARSSWGSHWGQEDEGAGVSRRL